MTSAKFSYEQIESYIEANYNKAIQKPIKKNVSDIDFPKMYWKDDDLGEVPLSFIRFLFIAAKSFQEYNPLLKQKGEAIYKMIDPKSGEVFANKLLELIEEKGGFYKKNEFLFTPMARLGGSKVIQAVKNAIISKKRANLVTLLSINASLEAAKALNEIPKFFKSKQGKTVLACKKDFKKIATKMGMTSLELQDELISDFGFIDFYFPFKTNKNELFRAFINSQFKLEYINDNEKTRKTPPPQIPIELKNHFKVLAKEIRTLTKEQKKTLEQAMVTGRLWKKASWEKHFLKKPLMFLFSQTILWAYLDEKNKIIEPFMVAQDQTLENSDYDEISLPENVKIKIIHPIELTNTQIKPWLNYLQDNEIITPFSQLDRPIYIPSSNILNQKNLLEFSEKKCLNIVGKAERSGWERGTIGDAGAVLTYFKTFEAANVDVFVQTEGLSIGYNYDCTFGRLYFVRHGSVDTSPYAYDDPRSNFDTRLLPLKSIPKTIFSEVMKDMNYFVGV
ncbi:MAG: DUF4132 domain-containing protein [Saprospiraceae bacterium]